MITINLKLHNCQISLGGRVLQDEYNIEAAASKLMLKPQPKTGSKNWTRLIEKVYEVDPLKCEGCGAEMKLIAFV